MFYMNLKSQKNIAAKILKCGKSRVWLDPARINDISDAITTEDVRKLVKSGVIKALPKKGISSYRIKKQRLQKMKGRRKGKGSRKGKLRTRIPKKRTWIRRIRSLRKLLKELKDKKQIENRVYRKLYMESKSGFFRSRSHLMTYLERNKLLEKDKDEEKERKKD